MIFDVKTEYVNAILTLGKNCGAGLTTIEFTGTCVGVGVVFGFSIIAVILAFVLKMNPGEILLDIDTTVKKLKNLMTNLKVKHPIWRQYKSKKITAMIDFFVLSRNPFAWLGFVLTENVKLLALMMAFLILFS